MLISISLHYSSHIYNFFLILFLLIIYSLRLQISYIISQNNHPWSVALEMSTATYICMTTLLVQPLATVRKKTLAVEKFGE